MLSKKVDKNHTSDPLLAVWGAQGGGEEVAGIT